MSVHEDILQGMRAHLRLVTGLADGKVIKADAKGPRPVKPYLTVKVLMHDAQVGEDEELRGLDGDSLPTFKVRGERRATVSVQGFGAATAAYLESASLRLREPTVIQALHEDGLVVDPIGGMQDIAALLGTSIEPRFGRDFDVSYRLECDEVSEVAAESVVTTDTFESPIESVADLVLTTTVDLTS